MRNESREGDHLTTAVEVTVPARCAERVPTKTSKAALALAERIAAAVYQDEEDGGCAIGAGVFGPNFSQLIRDLADGVKGGA